MKYVVLAWKRSQTLDCRLSKLKRLPNLLPELREVLLKDTPLVEDDPSSFYFDKEEVAFKNEERRYVDVSDISDTEYNVPLSHLW